MTNRSFPHPSRKLLWKRMTVPALALMTVGLGAVAGLQTSGPAQVPAAQVSTSRTPASLTKIHQHYQTVLQDWRNIPQVCKSDFPLTEFQKLECDRFWSTTLSRASLALLPFLLMGFGIWAIRRSQEQVYRYARTRVEGRKNGVRARATVELARGDLFSWIHCLKPAYVSVEEKRVLVYLNLEGPPLKGNEWVLVYELGQFLGKTRRVAVVLDC